VIVRVHYFMHGSQREIFIRQYSVFGMYLYIFTLTEIIPCFFLSCKANARV
jgi:hypothetical protein